ncbi:hypothetical protein QJS10_CPA06g01074 [Acorus calamus]|uniref:Uncharacterized protein n=1 Tax=Acorus calamus TaxID=4465 RepID=A0AAV9EJC8_ACOCL|nr:hypothetical protein QJS10_CPA06g01074 [Acorus calamus]
MIGWGKIYEFWRPMKFPEISVTEGCMCGYLNFQKTQLQKTAFVYIIFNHSMGQILLC